MVDTPKKDFSPLPVGKWVKSKNMFTLWRHQENKGLTGLLAERIGASAALCRVVLRKKAAVEKCQEMHFLSNEEKQKWIEDFVERETAVAQKRLQDADTAIMEDITTAANGGVTTGKPRTTFEEILNAIGDSLSDLASSDDEQNGEDKEEDEEDTELRKLSDDDAPCWVLGTITKTVQHCMESFWHKQMRLDELNQPGWGDAAKYFRERDMMFGTAELKVPAVVKPQIDTTPATPSPKTFAEHMQTLEIVWGQSEMLAVSSWPGTSQIRLGLNKTTVT